MGGFLEALESSGFGETIRLTPKLYPVLMSLHVIGIALLVGPAIVVDLRLLGAGRHLVPVSVCMRCLLPLCHLGFGLAAVTGITMFSGIAVQIGTSAAAPWKLALILAAAVNIVTFHKGIYKSVANWDLDAQPPVQAKIAAALSASIWVGTIFAGRFLAY